MIRPFSLSFIFCFSVLFACGQSAFLSQDLLDRLSEDTGEEALPVMILLKSPREVTHLKTHFAKAKTPAAERPREVVELLMENAAATQPSLLAFIENSGFQFANLRQLWIANIIALSAPKGLVLQLADHPLVERMDLNLPKYHLIEPQKGSASTAKTEGGIEPGLAAINAPAMWAMGYTGHGRIAYSIDTGVWPDHPALENRFLGNFFPLDQAWFAYDSPVPVDKSSSHGTHTVGTILGLAPETADTIGVAPGAYFISSDPVVSNLADVKPLTDFMLAYQWSLNPDGDLNTWNDVPDVINNSWGYTPDLGEAPCPDFVVPVFNAVEAAGIANVFSAGNEGPEPSTIGIPHNTNTGLVNSFTVAAVNGNTENFPVASFSSRGPSLCGGTGSLLIKPEVSAPGVDVRSAVANGAYSNYSGTSMAAPHVCGAVLLLKEAFPYLTGEEILLALYYSATDLGEPGEDNTYGMGMINVLSAFNYLSATHVAEAPQQLQNDIRIAEIIAPAADAEVVCSSDGLFTAQVEVQNSGVETISGFTLHYTTNSTNAQQIQISEPLAAGNSIILDLPEVAISPAGTTEFHVWIDTLNNEYDRFNNHAVRRWTQIPAGGALATEDFEDGIDTTFWTIVNSDRSLTWDTVSAIGPNGQIGLSAAVMLANYQVLDSQRDFLLTPLLEPLNNTTPMYLSFDYYYRRKNDISVTNDTLAVYFNTNCNLPIDQGVELFRAGGDDLYTVFESGSNSLPEQASDWQHLTLTLPAEAADNSFTLAFTSINRRGNNLLIDNIQLGSETGINESRPQLLSIRPNPAENRVTLLFARPLSVTASIKVTDISGKEIFRQHVNSAQQLDLNVSGWSAGLYFISVHDGDGQTATAKIIVR